MFKIKGLDKLTKKTDQLSKFVANIDGELANVSFDPKDPVSIEAAIQTAYEAIDEKAQVSGQNDWIASLVDQLKEHTREQILKRAAGARLEGDAK